MDAAMKLLRGSRVRRRACIPFRGADVTLLSHPPAFFEGLKTGIQTATSRISLASLYLGNGPKERELVSLLADACRRNRNLRVRIILDHSRALRGVNTTCASRASSVSVCSLPTPSTPSTQWLINHHHHHHHHHYHHTPPPPPCTTNTTIHHHHRNTTTTPPSTPPPSLPQPLLPLEAAAATHAPAPPLQHHHNSGRGGDSIVVMDRGGRVIDEQ